MPQRADTQENIYIRAKILVKILRIIEKKHTMMNVIRKYKRNETKKQHE